MANILRKAMGKGFLDYQNLGLKGRGAAASRAALPDRSWLSQVIPVLCSKLKSVGLTIEHVENLGYVMKEEQ